MRWSAGFPAYAGIDPVRLVAYHVGRRFPRIRGDRPFDPFELWDEIKVSPHTRG